MLRAAHRLSPALVLRGARRIPGRTSRQQHSCFDTMDSVPTGRRRTSCRTGWNREYQHDSSDIPWSPLHPGLRHPITGMQVIHSQSRLVDFSSLFRHSLMKYFRSSLAETSAAAGRRPRPVLTTRARRQGVQLHRQRPSKQQVHPKSRKRLLRPTARAPGRCKGWMCRMLHAAGHFLD